VEEQESPLALPLLVPSDRLAGTTGDARIPERAGAESGKGIVYWNTIYTQHALDDLPHDLAGDELAGLTPTLFEHVNPLGTYTFDTDRPAGQLRPLRAASAA
jgi:hypothetical protein